MRTWRTVLLLVLVLLGANNTDLIWHDSRRIGRQGLRLWLCIPRNKIGRISQAGGRSIDSSMYLARYPSAFPLLVCCWDSRTLEDVDFFPLIVSMRAYYVSKQKENETVRTASYMHQYCRSTSLPTSTLLLRG